MIQDSKSGIHSRAPILAWMALPFLLLTLAEPFVPALQSKALLPDFSLASNLIFLNNVHVTFSYFLIWKLQPFKDVFGSAPKLGLAAGVGLFTLLLMLSGWNWQVLAVLATMHAILQHTGLFLVGFTSAKFRTLAKATAWISMLLVVLLEREVLRVPPAVAYLGGALSFLTFAWMARSWLGGLYASRFFIWFCPGKIAGLSVAALHGLEYLVLVQYLLERSNVKLQARDIPVILLFLAVPVYYTLSSHFGVSHGLLDFAFLCCVYGHYAFDTYSFRFKFPRSRRLILPLFGSMPSVSHDH